MNERLALCQPFFYQYFFGESSTWPAVGLRLVKNKTTFA
jgi:hypothetical protein